jgi:hypothetical protein
LESSALVPKFQKLKVSLNQDENAQSKSLLKIKYIFHSNFRSTSQRNVSKRPVFGFQKTGFLAVYFPYSLSVCPVFALTVPGKAQYHGHTNKHPVHALHQLGAPTSFH